MEEVLTIDCRSWIVRQVIALDWHDGSREGFCWLEWPEVEFHFTLLGERECEDDLDDRIFVAKQVPSGTCSELLNKLSELGTPTGKEWCPVWEHPDKTYLKEVEAVMNCVIDDSTSSSGFVFWSRDIVRFLGCWPEPQHTDAIQDWFAYLKL